MRCLHVIDALDHQAPVRALLHLLQAAAADSPGGWIAHDVLALSRGPLEAVVRTHVRRLNLLSGGLEAAAAVFSCYDIVHVLDRRAARRLAPILTGGTAAIFVYSAPALDAAANDGKLAAEATDLAVLACCDLVVHAPVSDRAPDLDANLVHRSVCLDLARLVPVDALAPTEVLSTGGGSALLFIAREWAATLSGVTRFGEIETRAEAMHR
jgi:hypothetical protein